MVTNPGDLAEARERINRLRETSGGIKDYLLKANTVRGIDVAVLQMIETPDLLCRHIEGESDART